MRERTGSNYLSFPEMIAGVASMNGMANMVGYDTFLAAHLTDNVCADIYAAIHRSYGGTSQEVPAEYGKRSAGLHPELFTMPVGIAAGGADGLVPAASVQRLADTLVNRGINREEWGRPDEEDTDRCGEGRDRT